MVWNVTPNWDARAETNILCHNLTSDIDQPYGFDIAQTQMTEMETAPSLKNKWYGQKAKRLTCSTILEKTMKSSHNSTKIKRWSLDYQKWPKWKWNHPCMKTKWYDQKYMTKMKCHHPCTKTKWYDQSNRWPNAK